MLPRRIFILHKDSLTEVTPFSQSLPTVRRFNLAVLQNKACERTSVWSVCVVDACTTASHYSQAS